MVHAGDSGRRPATQRCLDQRDGYFVDNAFDQRPNRVNLLPRRRKDEREALAGQQQRPQRAARLALQPLCRVRQFHPCISERLDLLRRPDPRRGNGHRRHLPPRHLVKGLNHGSGIGHAGQCPGLRVQQRIAAAPPAGLSHQRVEHLGVDAGFTLHRQGLQCLNQRCGLSVPRLPRSSARVVAVLKSIVKKVGQAFGSLQRCGQRHLLSRDEARVIDPERHVDHHSRTVVAEIGGDLVQKLLPTLATDAGRIRQPLGNAPPGHRVEGVQRVGQEL